VPSEYHDFTERLALCLTALHGAVEAHIRAHFVADGICFASVRFEIDTTATRQLARIFFDDRNLWGDFRRAIQAHRKATHFTILNEHALFIGQLQGRLEQLQIQLVMLPTGSREGLIHYLNRIDGETGLYRDLADRRDLACRINQNAGIPLIDGFSLRALTYVFGEHSDVWQDFQSLVGTSADMVEDRQSIKGVGVRRMQP
jgi:hypothetical protein